MLQGLKGFDPNNSGYERKHETMTDRQKGIEMGMASNLITDMTIRSNGKMSADEITRAVKYSMIVIDAKKHKLDWKQAKIDLGIDALQKKYQTHDIPEYSQMVHKLDGTTEIVVKGGKQSPAPGASTLISRAKNGKVVTEIEEYNPKVKNPDGTWSVSDKKKVRNLKEVKSVDYYKDNPQAISSGSAIENAYLSHINNLRGISQKAVASYNGTTNQKRDPVIAKQYVKEQASIQAKLKEASKNAPKERQAQLIAEQIYRNQNTEDISKDAKARLKSQALARGRNIAGASRPKITITEKEWEAIDNHAITASSLSQLLRYADMGEVARLAKGTTKVSSSKLARAQALLDKGYTWAAVVQATGLSKSAIQYAMKEED
jgi:hypothetical protein